MVDEAGFEPAKDLTTSTLPRVSKSTKPALAGAYTDSATRPLYGG